MVGRPITGRFWYVLKNLAYVPAFLTSGLSLFQSPIGEGRKELYNKVVQD